MTEMMDILRSAAKREAGKSDLKVTVRIVPIPAPTPPERKVEAKLKLVEVRDETVPR